MKMIRWILIFVWVLGCTVTGSLPTTLHATPFQASPDLASPDLASPSATPTPAIPPLDVAELEQTLDRGDITTAVQQVEVGWQKQYEAYYQGQLTNQLLSADQISHSLERIAGLTDQKTSLIYVIPTPEHLELVLLSPYRPPLHRRVTAANKPALLQTVNAFRVGVVNPVSQPVDYLPAAQQLYQWIISPLESELQAQHIDTLIFCLGGGLRSVPLAALQDGHHFLIEKYSLAIIPAFNLIDQHPAFLSGTQVLAMGGSEFQQEEPLPAVPAELAAIRKLWAGETWLNQDFTLEKLKTRRSQFPFGIVHLATHATFAPGSVEASYIQFWDSSLKLNHLKDLDLRLPVVQMLVLSACKTALGDLNAELGFAGLAVQSGAKSALASLWSVSDTGTLLLMVNFYQQLKTSPIKAEALRQAQLTMLHGQAYQQSNATIQTLPQASLPPELQDSANYTDLSHPYYWAAFTFIGNPW
jgi:CHAT domain-containing protein